MEQFLTVVCDYLNTLGVKARTQYGNILIQSPTDATCEAQFNCYSFRRGIKIEGTHFKLRDAEKALGHIIKLIPEKLKQAALEKVHHSNITDIRGLMRVLPPMLQIGYESRANNGKGEFTLRIHHTEKETILAAADYLQDGGFCDAGPPEKEVGEFFHNRLLAIWRQMTEEDRLAFRDVIREQGYATE